MASSRGIGAASSECSCLPAAACRVCLSWLGCLLVAVPVIAQLAASSRGAGVVGNTALGLTTPGAGRMPSFALRLCSLGPALPAVQLAAPARRLAPGLRVRGARLGYPTAGPATAARGAFCACAAQAALLGVCPFPVFVACAPMRPLQRGFLSLLVRRVALGAPSHSTWSRLQLVRGASSPPAPALSVSRCVRTLGVSPPRRHESAASLPDSSCRCTVASGLFLSHCPPRLALERARASTRAPDRDVRHESSFLLPRCATVWNLLHAARYSSDPWRRHWCLLTSPASSQQHGN